jgi:hypothetical protein
VSGKTGYKRLTINIADELHDELQALADEREIDVTELVRRAIALDRFVWQHRDNDIYVGDAKRSTVLPRDEVERLRVAESIAERAADMWQPTFGLNPGEGLWVFPWAEDVADEAMTPEQVAWYRKRREARG